MDAPDPAFENPLPWEDPDTFPGFWDRVVETFRLAFTDPMAFMERAGRGEGLARPWAFLLFTSIPTYALLTLVFLALGAFLALVGLADAKENLFRQHPALAWILPLVLAGFLILLPLLQFLGMVLLGGLQHAFLGLFGGTRERRGVQATIRACTYAWAVIGLVCFLPSLIPYLGALIVLPLKVAGMVVTGMGLARVHRTDAWRGIAAALAPLVLAVALLVALIVGAVALAVRTQARGVEASGRAPIPSVSIRTEPGLSP